MTTPPITTARTVEVPAARVVVDQAKGIAAIVVEVAAARRATGWRRAALYAVAAHNVWRNVQTGRALVAYLDELHASRLDAALDHDLTAPCRCGCGETYIRPRSATPFPYPDWPTE